MPEFVSYHIFHNSDIKLFANDIKAYSVVNSLTGALLFLIIVNIMEEWCQVWQFIISNSNSQDLHSWELQLFLCLSRSVNLPARAMKQPRPILCEN